MIRGGVRIRQSYSDFNKRAIIWQGVENGHNTGTKPSQMTEPT